MRPSALSLALLTLLSAPTLGRADTNLPFVGNLKLTLTSVAPTADGHIRIDGNLDGLATTLGRFTGTVVYIVDPAVGSFTGSAIKIAANGDKIFESIVGQLFPDGSGSTGAFSVDGGTGRFRNASGGGFFASRFTTAINADVGIAAVIRLGH